MPDDPTAQAVLALAERVAGEDGAPPLSDQARSQVRAAGPGHVVVRVDGEVRGYAQYQDAVAELVTAPEVAEATLEAVLDAAAGPDGLTIWSHGLGSRLLPLLEARGGTRGRELFQLRRPGDAPLPADPPLPGDVTVRPFEVGRDEQAWLALNAAAFAAHAEQGRMTLEDLRARQAEPWFDPAGFLLAERDDQLLAFHWTKTHSDGAGEVYVLGVAPDAQGLGLGGALLIRGLRHLAERGCPYVLLYVDGDNPAALHLYERAGFARHDLDVQWHISP